MSKSYEPLHHKYRPQCFDELVGQESIVLTLKQALITNRIAPAYIFSGPRGTGKTSSARILARSLNCLESEQPTVEPCGKCEVCKTISFGSALDVIEIDAASNTGVDNIRELIEKSQFAPVQARWKVYVIDECHMLSTAAFNALLKTLEEPPKRVVFVLATTDPQRVLPTILSRCQRFDFRRIPLKSLINHLSMIAKKENIAIESGVLEVIAKHSQGGLRDAESMLDQLSLLPQPIQLKSVRELLGLIPESEMLNLIEALTKSDPVSTLKICREFLEVGREPIAILQGFAAMVRDLILKSAAPEQPELCSISIEAQEKLENISKITNLEDLFRWQSQLKGSENQLRHSLQPRLWLEVLFLGLLGKNNNESTKKIDSIPIKIDKNTVQEISNSKPLDYQIENEKRKIDISEKEVKSSHQFIESNKNLSEIWEKILESLELPSTKMLLSQQANLINLTREKAEITVSSNWFSMIQSRKSIIEAAINKTLGEPRELILKNQIDQQISKDKKLDFESVVRNTIIPPNANKSKPYFKDNQQENINDIEEKKQDIITNKNTKTADVEKLADFFNGQIINDPDE